METGGGPCLTMRRNLGNYFPGGTGVSGRQIMSALQAMDVAYTGS